MRPTEWFLVGVVMTGGCAGGGGEEVLDSAGAESDSAGDTAGDTAGEVMWSVSWTNSAATLHVAGGTGPFLLGFAEETAGGWLGEDGLPGPAGAGRGDDFDFNHSAMTDGLSLTVVADAGLVVPNETTLVTNGSAEEGYLAYMLADATQCWESGDTDDYYACLAL